ncbi:MAG TPA: preprotein translocase subunit YajC [Candidatus Mcinerneyibacterium sp.]|nr:preprotein translocase subunit YajC [Candidatus Mcinerneyibacterium sp.]
MANLLGYISANSSLFLMAEKQEGSLLMGFLPFILIFVVFYFVLIRPQKKQREKHDEMVSNLKPGDHVLTNSGIYGTITKIEDDKAVIRVADGVKLEFLKSTIAQKVNKNSNKEEE